MLCYVMLCYVIFRPYQRKLNYSVNIEMIDNCTQIPTTHECKDRVKYLGVGGCLGVGGQQFKLEISY